MYCKKCDEFCEDYFCNECSDEILTLYLIDNVIHFQIEKDLNIPPGTVMWWYNNCKLKDAIDIGDLNVKKQIKELERLNEEPELELEIETTKSQYWAQLEEKYLGALLKRQQKRIHSTKLTSSNIGFGINTYLSGRLDDCKLFLLNLYLISYPITTIFQIIQAIISPTPINLLFIASFGTWITTLYQIYRNLDIYYDDTDFKKIFYLTLFPPTFFIIYILPVRIINLILIFPLNPEVASLGILNELSIFM